MKLTFLPTALCLSKLVSAACDSPSPAFPLPDFSLHESSLAKTYTTINEAVKAVGQRGEYDKTSFSIEVTSQTNSLFDIHHTAKIRSSLRRGAKRITNETNYRIASITKPFTVLALLQLQKQGDLDLDDSVLKYIPELNVSQSGNLPWKDITIRALATQNAGIPQDLAQDDLAVEPYVAAQLGLPRASEISGPPCDALVNYTRACDDTDLLNFVKTLEPIFAPNQKSSYSNINFDLLGLVIANVSGVSYEEYVNKKILQEIGMKGSSFTTPPDSVAAVPAGLEYYWPFEVAVQNPTGGMYSSSSDMSRFLRHVLTSYNAQARGVNWFNPTSFSGSINTYYGMPWEIFRKRTNEVATDLQSSRPLTFITKSGGLPGYTSNVIIIPEYGLGVTILVAGNSDALGELRQIVTKELVRFGEKAAISELEVTYPGTYESNNVTMVISSSEEEGLFVKEWTTNGVDTLKGILNMYHGGGLEYQVLNIVPTLLFKDEEDQEGERWRILPRSKNVNSGEKRLFDNFCAAHWDFTTFNTKPLNEIVFWKGSGSAMNRAVLSGFRADLRKTGQDTSNSQSIPKADFGQIMQQSDTEL